MSKSEPSIFVGMDVHQDSVTMAVFEGASKQPTVVQKLPNDLRKLRRFFDRWAFQDARHTYVRLLTSRQYSDTGFTVG